MRKGFSLKNFLRDKRIREYRESRPTVKPARKIPANQTYVTMSIANAGIASGKIVPRPTPGGQPCLTLEPVSKKEDVDETELVQFSLKVRAGSAANAPVYKRKVARFESGTPAEWIQVLEALDEIFAQNSVVNAQDRENVIRTILRGDSWTAFESSIQEQRLNIVGEPLPLTVEMINNALKAVTNDVFPHRALINQVNWMKRRMRKPSTMSMRQFVASVSQMNSKLIRFPGATNADIFQPQDLLVVLEFALPDTWRAKFDLAGYIPTDHDKTCLVLEGEQIERALGLNKAASTKPKNATKNGSKNKKKNKAQKANGNTPASANSPTAKHQVPAKNNGGGKNFSGNKLRKELYALSKNKDRVQVIDQYTAVLEAERKKAVKWNASKKAKPSKNHVTVSTSDSSDDEVSVHVMDAEEVKQAKNDYIKRRMRMKNQRTKKRQVQFDFGTNGTNNIATTGTAIHNDADQMEEEMAFHEQINHSDDEDPSFAWV